MKEKPLVVLCWILVVIAVAFQVLLFINLLTAPAMQMDFPRTTRVVSYVVPGGAAERAGLRVGDKIVTVDGEMPRPGGTPLYFVRAGERVPVVFERDGVTRTTHLVPVPLEHARRDALRLGFDRAMAAVSAYITFPINLWMLAVGVALLVLRPNSKDARISALSFICWAGGNFLADKTGMGALLAPLPPSLRALIYLLDSYFIATFFAAVLHFGLVFPMPSGSHKRKWWEIIPYLLVVPIFFESAGEGLSLALPGRARVINQGEIYQWVGQLMLVATLVILAIRFSRTRELNPRRRLQLIFIALLPGVLGWMFSFAVQNISYGWNQIGLMVNKLTVIASSLIYAYAVVRHRMFNIRVLIRRSLQYALARGTLLVLMSLPVIGLGVWLYAHRSDSLAVLLTGTPAIYLLVILPLVVVARYRRRLLEALDRRYFREQYDARRLLLQVVSMIRGGSDMIGLSRVALDEIERALHPKHISLWQLDAEGQTLQRGFARGGPAHVPPLATEGALPRLLGTDDEPLDLHSRQTRPLVRRLPQEERDWLRDADAHLIVPLLIDQRLAGLMVLGERMSEEPYGSEDRSLLRMLAAQLALTFDYSRLKASPSLVWSPSSHATPLPTDEVVRSCSTCGRCYGADRVTCEFDQQPLIGEPGVPRDIDEKYVITKVLGRGGMGSVYLATQKRLNRPVAVKVLLSHLVGSASMRSRFEREARIVARLRHPGIVTIHDFGVLVSGHAYLVMEYLEGQTLRKTIGRGPLPLHEALAIIRPVGEAIDAAHRAGVVHRDLKPENIVIVRDHDEEYSPRVLDFGLAKMSGPIGDDEATLVQSGQSIGIVGTLMYMAPEVLSGKQADARSDQYSLALIAYELLAGLHPFAGATDLASIVRGHTEAVVPSIRTQRPDVPERAAAAIDRGLSKAREDRFESVGELVEELGQAAG